MPEIFLQGHILRVAGDALIYIIQWGLGVCKGVGGWESNILFATSFVALHFWTPMPPPPLPPKHGVQNRSVPYSYFVLFVISSRITSQFA